MFFKHLWMKPQNPVSHTETNMSVKAKPGIAFPLMFLNRWANPWRKARTGIAPLGLGNPTFFNHSESSSPLEMGPPVDEDPKPGIAHRVGQHVDECQDPGSPSP